MNFKVNRKTIKGFIIGSILSGLIFSGIGVIAVTIAADQIKYTPSNENFKVTNVEDAMDEIYKLAEYEIPKDTYFYEQGTEGDSETIVRYKKVNDEYFVCDKYGKIEQGSLPADVSSKILVPYIAVTSNDLNAGTAGFASNSLLLGSNIPSHSFNRFQYVLNVPLNSTKKITLSKKVSYAKIVYTIDGNNAELASGVFNYENGALTASPGSNHSNNVIISFDGTTLTCKQSITQTGTVSFAIIY